MAGEYRVKLRDYIVKKGVCHCLDFTSPLTDAGKQSALAKSSIEGSRNPVKRRPNTGGGGLSNGWHVVDAARFYNAPGREGSGPPTKNLDTHDVCAVSRRGLTANSKRKHWL